MLSLNETAFYMALHMLLGDIEKPLTGCLLHYYPKEESCRLEKVKITENIHQYNSEYIRFRGMCEFRMKTGTQSETWRPLMPI